MDVKKRLLAPAIGWDLFEHCFLFVNNNISTFERTAAASAAPFPSRSSSRVRRRMLRHAARALGRQVMAPVPQVRTQARWLQSARFPAFLPPVPPRPRAPRWWRRFILPTRLFWNEVGREEVPRILMPRWQRQQPSQHFRVRTQGPALSPLARCRRCVCAAAARDHAGGTTPVCVVISLRRRTYDHPHPQFCLRAHIRGAARRLQVIPHSPRGSKQQAEDLQTYFSQLTRPPLHPMTRRPRPPPAPWRPARPTAPWCPARSAPPAAACTMAAWLPSSSVSKTGCLGKTKGRELAIEVELRFGR